MAVKCIGILTSGGDAPGMNAAIRAVTRSAIYNGMKVKGIYRGYKGLLLDEIEEFKTQNVSNIIQRGGTILKTARCAEFKTPEGRKEAYERLKEHGIEALVAIGGDGTLTGARIFAQEYDYPIVGLPGTIDNDLYGTDVTIGYDTALNTIMECVDKIRDTATSHDRLFFIEVMGRDAGFLALNGAIASGAEAAIIPEISLEKDQLAEMIETGFRKSKNSSIVLVAESEYGAATEVPPDKLHLQSIYSFLKQVHKLTAVRHVHEATLSYLSGWPMSHGRLSSIPSVPNVQPLDYYVRYRPSKTRNGFP